MKKITIPIEFGQPVCSVWINDKKYVLETGKEIEVEDHIADFMTAAINSSEPDMPQGTPPFGGGSAKPVFFWCNNTRDPLHPYGNAAVTATAQEIVDAYFAGCAYVVEGVSTPNRIIGFAISQSDNPGSVLVPNNGMVFQYMTGCMGGAILAEIAKYSPQEG